MADREPLLVANGDDEYFECILETDYVTVPDMKAVVKYVKKRWSERIGSVTPSTMLETGMKKKVKVFRFKKEPSSWRCVNFIENQGAPLPNVFGLAVAEMTVGSKLPKDTEILGFDNPLDLPFGRYPWVPFLLICSGGDVHHRTAFWGERERFWGTNYCLVLLCD